MKKSCCYPQKDLLEFLFLRKPLRCLHSIEEPFDVLYSILATSTQFPDLIHKKMFTGFLSLCTCIMVPPPSPPHLSHPPTSSQILYKICVHLFISALCFAFILVGQNFYCWRVFFVSDVLPQSAVLYSHWATFWEICFCSCQFCCCWCCYYC